MGDRSKTFFGEKIESLVRGNYDSSEALANKAAPPIDIAEVHTLTSREMILKLSHGEVDFRFRMTPSQAYALGEALCLEAAPNLPRDDDESKEGAEHVG